MPSRLILTIAQGKYQRQSLTFEERTTCILGRAEECWPGDLNDPELNAISRHHCLLDVNPPEVRVRDLGSRNGTFVNNKRIGQREAGIPRTEAEGREYPEHDLNDGDILDLGHALYLRIQIHRPKVCQYCGAEFNSANQPNDSPACDRCRDITPEGVPITEETRHLFVQTQPCSYCGRVVHNLGPAASAVICLECKEQPSRVLEYLALQADSGRGPVGVLRGFRTIRELGREAWEPSTSSRRPKVSASR